MTKKKENWLELRNKKSGYGAILPAITKEPAIPNDEKEEPQEET